MTPRRLSLLATAVASLALLGCAGANLPGGLDSLMPGGGSNSGMRTVGKLPPPPTRTWRDARADVVANRADGWGLVAMPDMEPYLNGLLTKIKATAGVPDWQGTVHVMADTSLNAYSTAAGNIYISIYWLEVAQSEDEIYALLSHEFGHIYLNHHAIYDVKTAGETTAAVTSMAWSYANKRAGDTGWSGVDNIFVVQALGTRALFPAWQRSVEEEADRFGATVSLKSGYSYLDGFKALFERMASYDEKAKADRQRLRALQTAADREQSQRNAAKQPLVPASVAKTPVTGIPGNVRNAINAATAAQPDLKSSINATAFDVQRTLEDQVSEASASIQQTHADAADREAALRKQVEPLVGDSTPDARIAPWEQARKRGSNGTIIAHYGMAAQIQTLQASRRFQEAISKAESMASGPTANDGLPLYTLANLTTLSNASAQDAAIRTLRRNLSAREPSWRAQVNLASRMAVGSPAAAKTFIQKQFDDFGRAPLTWPDIIAFYRDHGSQQQAREMAVTCAANYPAYRVPCQKASETPSDAKAGEKSFGDRVRDAMGNLMK